MKKKEKKAAAKNFIDKLITLATLIDEYDERTHLWDLYLMNENLFNEFVNAYTQKTGCKLKPIDKDIDNIFRKNDKYIIEQSYESSEPFTVPKELSRKLDPYFYEIEKDILNE